MRDGWNPGPWPAEGLEPYLEELARILPLTGADRDALVGGAAAGDEVAGQRLVEAYLPMVVEIAQAYEPRGVRTVDLLLAGNVGLARAVRRLPELPPGCDSEGIAAAEIKRSIATRIARG
jgi:DNA-directed RNA polymerase sigma subunit (sigma70/sigma32)